MCWPCHVSRWSVWSRLEYPPFYHPYLPTLVPLPQSSSLHPYFISLPASPPWDSLSCFRILIRPNKNTGLMGAGDSEGNRLIPAHSPNSLASLIFHVAVSLSKTLSFSKLELNKLDPPKPRTLGLFFSQLHCTLAPPRTTQARSLLELFWMIYNFPI